MPEIKTFAVIGAGQMGRGIAQVAAQASVDVLLLDASLELAEKGKGRIDAGLGRLVEKGKMTPEDRASILGRIAPIGDYGALKSADMVVEAATENLDLKLKIFAQADEAAKGEALLASNTSSISLTKLAGVT
ncbi:MAG: 3-hydroxybutyryl-CoA dehydrogenase, partial [Myxococcales bacterium]|nr:3-hydroxybutyryl-CoA dehydrogenase [Myxococcales bacterium]